MTLKTIIPKGLSRLQQNLLFEAGHGGQGRAAVSGAPCVSCRTTLIKPQ